MAIFFILSFLWFLRQTKATLFWIYLWQLKEYHLGRFLDLFRTERGKKLFFNWLFILKIVLLLYAVFLALPKELLIWQLYAVWIVILIIVYFCEFLKFLLDFFRKQLKKPILTKKTSFLISTSLIVVILFVIILFQKTTTLYWFAFSLLSFDILFPFIVSGIVLLFQPITILLRNQIIKKAAKKRERFKDLIVIGITGSFGKTSTKEFLATILSEKFKVLKTKEHQNSEMGISQCILNDLKPEHEVFVVEMAAYNKGGIRLLCDIAKPKIGIVTGVNEQHLATFGSMENLLSAEGGKELIESLSRSQPKIVLRGLPIDSMVFFNARNKYCVDLYEKTEEIKKFLYGENVQLQGLENIEGAKMIAKELGMQEKEIFRACQKIENKFPGIEIKKGINGLNIIDATYSANPDGVIAHLEYLKTFSGKKIIVMSCLIELGKASKEIHQKIGWKIAEACDLAIITTKDRFKEIKKGALEKGMNEKNILFSENGKEIFEKIESFLEENNVILLEGRLPSEVIQQLTMNLFKS